MAKPTRGLGTGEGEGRWPERIRRAWYLYQAKHGSATQEEVGDKVAALLGRDPFTRQQINDYFTKVEPRFTVGVAFAVALEHDPVALAGLVGGSDEEDDDGPEATRPGAPLRKAELGKRRKEEKGREA